MSASRLNRETTVLVVGTGVMGIGIAQVAAQYGHTVKLFDTREGAAEAAVESLRKKLESIVAKGKLAQADADATIARLQPVSALSDAADAGLVVEAIVERLEVKRELFATLEGILAADAVLATNTSSISVTAIAKGLQQPGRVVGMHFFNPVPLMKLVEVVSGLQTLPAVAQAIFDLSEAWGKTAVHAASTPGFIVNRIARPYYAETLALLQERAASPSVLDACLRGAGFRMGPCELMDLIGHDTNFSVTQSVYEANFFDKRFVPSLVQKALVDGGLLGRKSGQGFYRYDETGKPQDASVETATDAPAIASDAGLVWRLAGKGAATDRLAQALDAAGIAYQADSWLDWQGLQVSSVHEDWSLRLQVTDGRTATELRDGMSTEDRQSMALAVMDIPMFAATGAPLAWAGAEADTAACASRVAAVLAALGWQAQQVTDAAGLVVARTLAMLINEAADAVLQGVCDEAGADAAMKLGVNYPAGPFEWLNAWSAAEVVDLLDRLDSWYRGERYRVSPWLRARALAV